MYKINNISVVILTYSDRRSFVFKILIFLKKYDFNNIILVLNGVTWDVDGYGCDILDGIDIVRLSDNFGPAIGYSEGIKHALRVGAELVWLLDDDNLPREDAVHKLLYRFNQYFVNNDMMLALSSARPTYQNTANAFSLHSLVPMHSCFMGFHVFHVVYKLLFFFNLVTDSSDANQSDLRIVTAPYGGLLFHAGLVGQIGFPRNDFVIYADDSEWTYRIIDNGGRIYLIPDAVIDDLDCSWDNSHQYLFYIWLEGLSDIKAYYRMRNCVFFYKNSYCKNKYIYVVNKCIYLLAILLKSLFKRKINRFFLLYRAIIDGEHGRLGVYKNFSL